MVGNTVAQGQPRKDELCGADLLQDNCEKITWISLDMGNWGTFQATTLTNIREMPIPIQGFTVLTQKRGFARGERPLEE